MNDDFEVMETGTAAAMAATVDRYWECQWLIGFHSDSPANQWAHDMAVQARRESRS